MISKHFLCQDFIHQIDSQWLALEFQVQEKKNLRILMPHIFLCLGWGMWHVNSMTEMPPVDQAMEAIITSSPALCQHSKSLESKDLHEFPPCFLEILLISDKSQGQPPFGSIKPPVNSGTNYKPQLVSLSPSMAFKSWICCMPTERQKISTPPEK